MSVIIRVIYEGTTYDLDIQEDIPLRLDVSTIENTSIGETFGIGSQTFDLPGTRTNNKFFKHAYNVGGEDIPAFYNTISGYIISKSETLLKGQFQLLEVVTDEDGYVVYKCQMSDETIQFKDSLQNKLIKNGDWSSYTHTLSKENIVASWNNNLLGGSVYYPMADYGRTQDEKLYPDAPIVQISGSVGYIGSDSTPLNLKQLLPAVKVKDTLDVIFNQVGFQYSGSFVEKEDFNNLYILNKPKEGLGVVVESVATSDFEATGVSNQTIPINQDCFLSASVEVLDPANAYNPTTGVYTVPESGEFTFQGQIGFFNPVSTFSSAITNINFFFAIDNSPEIVPIIDTLESLLMDQSKGVGPHYINVSWTGIFTAGLKLRLMVNMEQFTGPPALNLTLLQNSTQFKAVDTPITYEGAEVDMSKQWQGDTKSIDILKGLITQFNLVLTPDKVDNKLINIDTFDDWMRSGEVKDWTEKWNTATRTSINHTVDELKQELFLKNADDNDRFSKLVIDSDPNEQYGTLRILADNNVSQGTRNIESFFSPIILGGSVDFIADGEQTFSGTYDIDLNSKLVIPHIYKWNNKTQESYTSKPRLGYKVTAPLTSGSVFYIGSSTDSIGVSGSYTTISNLAQLPAVSGSTSDLHFNNSYPTFTGTGLNLNSGRTSFNEYWKTYIDSLYWEGSKKVTLDVKFSPHEYKDINLNDRIFIKDQQYRINKIEGFNLTDTDVVTVELIRLYPAYYQNEFDCEFEFTVDKLDCDFTFEAVPGVTPPPVTPTPTPTPAPYGILSCDDCEIYIDAEDAGSYSGTGRDIYNIALNANPNLVSWSIQGQYSYDAVDKHITLTGSFENEATSSCIIANDYQTFNNDETASLLLHFKIRPDLDNTSARYQFFANSDDDNGTEGYQVIVSGSSSTIADPTKDIIAYWTGQAPYDIGTDAMKGDYTTVLFQVNGPTTSGGIVQKVSIKTSLDNFQTEYLPTEGTYSGLTRFDNILNQLGYFKKFAYYRNKTFTTDELVKLDCYFRQTSGFNCGLDYYCGEPPITPTPTPSPTPGPGPNPTITPTPTPVPNLFSYTGVYAYGNYQTACSSSDETTIYTVGEIGTGSFAYENASLTQPFDFARFFIDNETGIGYEFVDPNTTGQVIGTLDDACNVEIYRLYISFNEYDACTDSVVKTVYAQPGDLIENGTTLYEDINLSNTWYEGYDTKFIVSGSEPRQIYYNTNTGVSQSGTDICYVVDFFNGFDSTATTPPTAYCGTFDEVFYLKGTASVGDNIFTDSDLTDPIFTGENFVYNDDANELYVMSGSTGGDGTGWVIGEITSSYCTPPTPTPSPTPAPVVTPFTASYSYSSFDEACNNPAGTSVLYRAEIWNGIEPAGYEEYIFEDAALTNIFDFYVYVVDTTTGIGYEMFDPNTTGKVRDTYIDICNPNEVTIHYSFNEFEACAGTLTTTKYIDPDKQWGDVGVVLYNDFDRTDVFSTIPNEYVSTSSLDRSIYEYSGGVLVDTGVDCYTPEFFNGSDYTSTTQPTPTCGTFERNLYTKNTPQIGSVIYNDAGYTDPIFTGNNWVYNDSANELYQMGGNSSVGEEWTIQSIITNVCTPPPTPSPTPNVISYTMQRGYDSEIQTCGTVYGQQTVYSNGTIAVGKTLYADAGLTTPIDFYAYYRDINTDIVWRVSTLTGQVLEQTTFSCPTPTPVPTTPPTPSPTPVPNVYVMQRGYDALSQVCGTTYGQQTVYSRDVIGVGVTLYEDINLTTSVDFYQYYKDINTDITWRVSTLTGEVLEQTTFSCPTPTPVPTATPTPTPTPSPTPAPTPTPTPAPSNYWMILEGELCTQSSSTQRYNWYGDPNNFPAGVMYDANSGWCMNMFYISAGQDGSLPTITCNSVYSFYNSCSDCQSDINEVPCN